MAEVSYSTKTQLYQYYYLKNHKITTGVTVFIVQN